MKHLLLACALAVGTAATASDHVVSDTMRNLAAASPMLSKAKGPYKLPNGNSLYLLTESNMPCVVPAPQHYKMPNLATKQAIPSPQAPGAMPQVKPVPPLRYTSGKGSAATTLGRKRE